VPNENYISAPLAGDRWNLLIRQVEAHDATTVAAVLTAAAQWLEDGGKWNDWPIPYPVAALIAPIADGEVYLVNKPIDNAPVATVTLKWSDERYWGPRPADAGYLHRLAVTPQMMGLGVGAAIVSWAISEIRVRNRTFLRLDCPRQNAQLRRYYEAKGFGHVGDYISPSGYKAALYEHAVD
jgi:protein-tyrosine phosphatase